VSDGPNPPVERDPFVARALRSMPVPDHRPGFWSELEARLAVIHAARSGQQRDPAIPPMVSDEMPSSLDARELPLAEPRLTESRRERRVRQRRVLLRVAAVVLITAAGTALILSRTDERNLGPNDVPVTTTAVTPKATTVPATTTPVTPAPTTVSEPPARTPQTAVQEFVQAIGGDSEAAFATLTNESREFLGSPAQLAAGFAQEFGPWSSPSAIEQETVMVARSPAATQIAVVTYTGTFDVQGAPQPRTQAFALLREGGAWRISLTAIAQSVSAGPAIDMITPAVEPALECCGIGRVVAEGEPIRFRTAVSPEIELVSVAFDGAEALDAAQLELTDSVVTARPHLESGPHVVTIAVVLRDGVFYARAVQFVVE
jgi:hypothetical protein